MTTSKTPEQSYQSITTPDLRHDPSNMITELILLNRDWNPGPYPWKGKYRAFWGKTVAVVRRMIRDHGLSPDQIAFYVYRCNPTEINGEEFGKVVTVAKKLFQRYDLQGLVESYRQKGQQATVSRLETTRVSKPRTAAVAKSVLEFIKELEDGTKKEGGSCNEEE